MQINLLCLIWKLGMSPFICHMVAWSAPTGCRVTDQNVEVCWLTPEHSKSMQKLVSLRPALIIWICQKISKFLYPNIAQYLLFQMRYGSLVCSKQWLCETQICWGMFFRLEETTVLERQENRGCLSFLSATWLFLGVRWAIIPHLKEDVKGYVLI